MAANLNSVDDDGRVQGVELEIERCLREMNVPDEERKERFVELAMRELVPLWDFTRIEQRARPLLDRTLHAGSLILDESLLWLGAIRRRLSGRRSLRRPYYAEITRSIPRGIFNVFMSVVRGVDGFARPFCIHGKNRKGEVVSFTSIRLVKELFSLLTSLPSNEVVGHLKRTLDSGIRSDHKVFVIVNDNKDFAFSYNYRKGELKISFHYGEFNIAGAPQHN